MNQGFGSAEKEGTKRGNRWASPLFLFEALVKFEERVLGLFVWGRVEDNHMLGPRVIPCPGWWFCGWIGQQSRPTSECELLRVALYHQP